jgi:type VI secretion system ImpA/VasJ family protein
MAEMPIAELVTELLKPLSGKNPTGEDVARSDDPVASAAYTDLEMEIGKVGEVNYQKAAEMAVDILIKYSKHLRVASWLCLSWFRVEGPEGLKNGLLLIMQFLKTFSKQLHPEKPAHKSKALQFISTDKRFHSFEKVDISNPEIVPQIVDLLTAIKSEADKLMPDNSPDLSQLAEMVKSRQGTATAAPEDKTEDSKEEPELEEESDSIEKEKKEEPAAQEEAPKDDTKTDEEDSEEKEIEISNEVSELLEDISSDKPVGENIEETEDQDAQVKYMALESEIVKYSGNDYPKCLKLAQDVLQNHCKNLRVAVWLLITWFRTEKLDGFKNGIQLLLELIKKYGADLYPTDIKQKSRALQMLNTETRLKIIEKEKATQQNAPILKDISKLYLELVEQTRTLLADAPPKLSAIDEIIADKITEVKEVLEGKKKEVTQAAPQPTPTTQKAPATTTAATIPTPSREAPVPSTGGISISDDKSAKVAIKKALQFYFEDDGSDPPKKKISADPMVYSISRALRWSKVKQPSDKESITQIEGPNEPKQNYILKLYNNKDWDTLIPELEINFISNNSFIFWLDTQRFIVEAMRQKGGEFDNAVEEIKTQVAHLLAKFPGLTNLIFKDTKTAFANIDTIAWINDEVVTGLAGGKTVEKILPPIMGEDYDQINIDYENACEELPKNFEENLKVMQQSIEGETRKKGRFLRLLNLANYCYLAKKYPLAQPFFGQLQHLIEEFNISEWETALCVAVWQSSFLNNNKLLDGEKNKEKKSVIEQ